MADGSCCLEHLEGTRLEKLVYSNTYSSFCKFHPEFLNFSKVICAFVSGCLGIFSLWDSTSCRAGCLCLMVSQRRTEFLPCTRGWCLTSFRAALTLWWPLFTGVSQALLLMVSFSFNSCIVFNTEGFHLYHCLLYSSYNFIVELCVFCFSRNNPCCMSCEQRIRCLFVCCSLGRSITCGSALHYPCYAIALQLTVCYSRLDLVYMIFPGFHL